MKWTIFKSKISKTDYLRLHARDYIHSFDKDYRLSIQLIEDLKDVAIRFNNSPPVIEGTRLSEIEVLILLKDYKEQIINRCKKIKDEQQLSFESNVKVRDGLIEYLLNFVNNI